MLFVLSNPLLAFRLFSVFTIRYAGGETRAISLDILKAFCKVWHSRLLVVGPILSILEFFLQESSLKVVLDGQSSPLCITNAGVPQGSVLVPTLFLVYQE